MLREDLLNRKLSGVLCDVLSSVVTVVNRLWQHIADRTVHTYRNKRYELPHCMKNSSQVKCKPKIGKIEITGQGRKTAAIASRSAAETRIVRLFLFLPLS